MKLSPKTFFKLHLYENVPTPPRKRKKVSSEDFVIPSYEEWEKTDSTGNYNVSQLKDMARYYKQKVSGNKKELVKRIYNHLRFSSHAIKVQKTWRAIYGKKLQ